MEQRKSKNGTNVCCKIKGGNILSYVNFSKICHIINSFTELKQKIGKEDINFPLSSSSISIEWQNKNILEL